MLARSPKTRAASATFARLSEFASFMAILPRVSYALFPSSKRVRADDFAAGVGGEGAVDARVDTDFDEMDAAVAEDEVAAGRVRAAEAADVVVA